MHYSVRRNVRGRSLTVFGAILVLILVVSLGSLLSGWALMIALGMLAGYANAPGLAIGYWASVGLALLLRLALSSNSSSSSES